MTRYPVVFLSLLFTLSSSISTAYRDDVRFTELSEELTLRGIAIPTGANITVTQVEASSSSEEDNYLPDATNPEFSGKTIIDQTQGGGTSSHATTVGVNLFGNETSIAPGISTIDVYFANEWLSSEGWSTGFRTPSESNPLQNHSWISTTTSTAPTLRMDYAVVQDGFLPVAGLNNSTTTTVPTVYGSIYNGITVGRSDGGHSQGGTVYDTAGRLKPEIVVPSGATSFATPIITATAALLIENAGNDIAAKDQLTLKAILLAGADKSAVSAWSQTASQPIDTVYGAGQIDVYESYFIQEGGQQGTGSVIGEYGWNLATVSSSQADDYDITVPAGFELRDLSVILTWNRIVNKIGPSYLAETLPDLELNLLDVNNAATLQTSDSSLDNLEHIWRDAGNALSEGSYALSIQSDATAEYSIAWRSQLYQDYTLWSSTAFTEITPVADRDADDDPEGDGIENRLEQAFGGNPELADPEILPVFEIVNENDNEYLQISFRRPTFENGLTYTVETVTDLGSTWSSAEADVTLVSINSESEGYDRYTYRCVEPVSAHPQAFLRVAISE